MTDSIIPFAACHRGSGMHADVNIDYDGARISEMAKYIASISNSGIEFERIARITNGGNAKSIDAFYYDDVEEVVHIIEFKSGKEYSSHKAQMAMYVYAIQREFNAVRDGIQIRTHVKYFDNPQHDVVVDIQMESRSITEEFSSRNPKMFTEMFNVVADKEASKARTRAKNETPEAIEAVKAYKRAHDKTEKGAATIKAYRKGSNCKFSSKQREYNRKQKNKETVRNGGTVVKKKRVMSEAVKAKKAADQAIIDNMPPVVFY